ncbi:uncharacterized protein LOC117177277 [Belonocnema kinseyi]|uniref:uncharacterized protein LOC117177277 n=1 Tax=Belonocnema kinseyi TaxID=2817044 RepID=UPI00143D4CFB|nr:uncharacterized protein LOC117177277 [Belonocnema kinseyi]
MCGARCSKFKGGIMDICISTGFESMTATKEDINCLKDCGIKNVIKVHDGVCTHEHTFYHRHNMLRPENEDERILCGSRCEDEDESVLLCVTDGFDLHTVSAQWQACAEICKIDPVILHRGECPPKEIRGLSYAA